MTKTALFSVIIVGLSVSVPAGAQVHQPGKDGVGYPKCAYCPDPEYSSEALKAHYEGMVWLQGVITAQGRATNIRVVKSPGMGLDKKAIEVVQSRWRFNPAKGPDGKPVAVDVPIGVTFRLSPKKPFASGWATGGL